MSRSPLKIVLLGTIGVLLASTALGGVPDPVNCVVPAFLKVGGVQSPLNPLPDPTISYTVTVRDFANNPVNGSLVRLDFVNCTDTHLCCADVAGQARDFDCVACTGPRSVSGVTGPAGTVTFFVLGAADNPGSSVPPAIWPGAGAGCVRVYASTVLVGTATAVDYDQNGAIPANCVTAPTSGNGVNGLDLSISKNDIGAAGLGAAYKGRSDYFGDYTLNGLDLSVHKGIVGNSGLGIGSLAGCYGGGVYQPYFP